MPFGGEDRQVGVEHSPTGASTNAQCTRVSTNLHQCSVWFCSDMVAGADMTKPLTRSAGHHMRAVNQAEISFEVQRDGLHAA